MLPGYVNRRFNLENQANQAFCDNLFLVSSLLRALFKTTYLIYKA